MDDDSLSYFFQNLNCRESQKQESNYNQQQYYQLQYGHNFFAQQKPQKTNFNDNLLDIDNINIPSLKRRNQQDKMPTYREINESIELLKQTIPHRNVDAIIQILYWQLLKDNSSQNEDKIKYPMNLSNEFKLGRFTNSINSIDENIKLIGKIEESDGFSRYFYKKQQIKSSYKDDAAQKQAQKQFVAQTIILIGKLKNSLLKSVESILGRSLDFNCAAFSPYCCPAGNILGLIKFVSCYYENFKIESKQITSWIEETQFQATGRADFGIFDNIWNRKCERQLIDVYKYDYHFTTIRQYFQEAYPQCKDIFTIQLLKKKFFKLLRVSLRKLCEIGEKNKNYSATRLVKYNDNRIKCIQRSPDGRQVRLLLLDFYLAKGQMDVKALHTIITSINEFIAKKQHEKIKDSKYHFQDLEEKNNNFDLEVSKSKPTLNNIKVKKQAITSEESDDEQWSPRDERPLRSPVKKISNLNKLKSHK